MKKEEKQIIFNLLKTADSYVNGYQRECFADNIEFQDDEENIEIKASSKAEPEKSVNNKINEVTRISENLKNVESAAQKMFANVNKAVSEIKPVSSIEDAFDAPKHTTESLNKNESFQEEHQNRLPYSEEHILGKAPDITAVIPDEKLTNSRISFKLEENKTSSDKSSGITLDQLNQKILRCTRCGLARTRNNVVPGEGVLNPDVFVIGEGPGYDEDMQGHPFVGRAGLLLDKMLHAIYLDRHENCFIGNIVKCRPPQNRNPFPDEQDACFPFLETQIHILKPKMILCLGKVAIEKIMNRKISINACHGQFFDYNGIPVMVTYHPSALLRNQSLKRPAWEDLKGFSRKLDSVKKALGEPVNHELKCLQGK